jgi:hypothetical protein
MSDDTQDILEALEASGIDYHVGTITAFRGSWGSGVGFLEFLNDDGSEYSVPCDNGPTVRALDAAFGDVISPGHSVDNAAIAGQRVAWFYDDMGLLLGGFVPL